MIELNKKYRVKADDWAPVELWHGDEDNIFGRVGCYPMSWFRGTGDVDQIPHGIQHLRDDLALVEVLPKVTVRKYVFDNNSSVFTADISTFANNCLGAIDITHNGKEITDVRVVK